MDMKKINVRKRNISKFIFLMISLAAVVSFFAGNQVLAQYETGSPAPDFTLNALDGESYALNQFDNKQAHLLLFFAKSDDSDSMEKLLDLIAFFEDFQPKESYHLIVVVENNEYKKEAEEKFLSWQKDTKIPLLILLDEESKVVENYQIERYPTILLLRPDLYVRRVYDQFTGRQERSFYQYLSFIMTSRKSADSDNNDCNNGVCPPPPGF